MDGEMKIKTIELRENQRLHLGKASPLVAPLIVLDAVE
jgi:hypothetical protein